MLNGDQLKFFEKSFPLDFKSQAQIQTIIEILYWLIIFLNLTKRCTKDKKFQERKDNGEFSKYYKENILTDNNSVDFDKKDAKNLIETLPNARNNSIYLPIFWFNSTSFTLFSYM